MCPGTEHSIDSDLPRSRFACQLRICSLCNPPHLLAPIPRPPPPPALWEPPPSDRHTADRADRTGAGIAPALLHHTLRLHRASTSTSTLTRVRSMECGERGAGAGAGWEECGAHPARL